MLKILSSSELGKCLDLIISPLPPLNENARETVNENYRFNETKT